MKKFSGIFFAAIFVITFAMVSNARADGSNTSQIAGTWSGNTAMPGNSRQHIIVKILTCTAGSPCGSVQNNSVRCTWELTFDGMQGNSYVFHHSRLLSGQCPFSAENTGYYTPQPDGSLLRVQYNPGFTTAGFLYQR